MVYNMLMWQAELIKKNHLCGMLKDKMAHQREEMWEHLEPMGGLVVGG